MTATGDITVSLDGLKGVIGDHLRDMYLLRVTRCFDAGEITAEHARWLAGRTESDWMMIDSMFPIPPPPEAAE